MGLQPFPLPPTSLPSRPALPSGTAASIGCKTVRHWMTPTVRPGPWWSLLRLNDVFLAWRRRASRIALSAAILAAAIAGAVVPLALGSDYRWNAL